MWEKNTVLAKNLRSFTTSHSPRLSICPKAFGHHSVFALHSSSMRAALHLNYYRHITEEAELFFFFSLVCNFLALRDTHTHVNQAIEKWKAHLFSCRQLEKLSACSLSLSLSLSLVTIFNCLGPRAFQLAPISRTWNSSSIHFSFHLEPPSQGAWTEDPAAARLPRPVWLSPATATGLRPRTGGESRWAHLYLAFNFNTKISPAYY